MEIPYDVGSGTVLDRSMGSLCLMGEVAMGAHVASFPGRACSHIDGGRKAMKEGRDKFSGSGGGRRWITRKGLAI